MIRAQTPDDPEFRLRPRRPGVARDESKVWSRSFKSLIHLVRITSRGGHPSPESSSAPGRMVRKPHLQRCAVRITYSSNRVRGQWGAHGRYIARESANGDANGKGAGFSADSDNVDVAASGKVPATNASSK